MKIIFLHVLRLSKKLSSPPKLSLYLVFRFISKVYLLVFSKVSVIRNPFLLNLSSLSNYMDGNYCINFLPPLISQTRQGGVAIESIWSGKSGTSKLTLGLLQFEDSGNYSCTSKGLESEQVFLHVVSNLKGKYQYSTQKPNLFTRRLPF